jgi:uncharacterized protein YlaI
MDAAAGLEEDAEETVEVAMRPILAFKACQCNHRLDNYCSSKYYSGHGFKAKRHSLR